MPSYFLLLPDVGAGGELAEDGVAPVPGPEVGTLYRDRSVYSVSSEEEKDDKVVTGQPAVAVKILQVVLAVLPDSGFNLGKIVGQVDANLFQDRPGCYVFYLHITVKQPRSVLVEIAFILDQNSFYACVGDAATA